METYTLDDIYRDDIGGPIEDVEYWSEDPNDTELVHRCIHDVIDDSVWDMSVDSFDNSGVLVVYGYAPIGDNMYRAYCCVEVDLIDWVTREAPYLLEDSP